MLCGILISVAGLSQGATKGWGAEVQYGSIFAHSEAVQNTKGSLPVGLSLQYNWQARGKKDYDVCRCYPRQSLFAAAYHFDNAVLGNSYMLAYQLEPSYRIGRQLFFTMRGAVGGAWATRPYHPISNPTNQSYSTHLNAYLMYGLGLNWQWSEKWQLSASGNFQHISNGGLKQPNKGVNWPTFGFGLFHYPNPQSFYVGQRGKDTSWRHAPLRKDIAVFGVAKRMGNENGTGTRQPVVGAGFQLARQVGRIHAFTAGAEISRDQTIVTKLDRDTLTGSPWRAGLLAGHEFLLGRFIFSQRVGVYVYNNNPYYDAWFHRWGLQYRFARQWWFGFNLNAHRHVADYIDLRFVYSWQ